MVARFVKDRLETMCKETVVAYFNTVPRMCVVGVRKPQTTSIWIAGLRA